MKSVRTRGNRCGGWAGRGYEAPLARATPRIPIPVQNGLRRSAPPAESSLSLALSSSGGHYVKGQPSGQVLPRRRRRAVAVAASSTSDLRAPPMEGAFDSVHCSEHLCLSGIVRLENIDLPACADKV